MLNIKTVLFAFFAFLSIIFATECLEEQNCDTAKNEKFLQLSHSFSLLSDVFQDRGSLVVTRSEEGKLKLKFSEKQMNIKVTDEIIESIASNSLYRVKLQLGESRYLMGFVSTCDLAAANFQQSFTFHLSSDGDIIGFFIQPFMKPSENDVLINLDCRRLAEEVKKSGEIQLKSKATASLPSENHHAPLHYKGNVEIQAQVNEDGQESQSEMFEDAKKKQASEAEQDQPFYRKYWYIFLPMLLMTVFNGPAQPEQQPVSGGTGVKTPAAPGPRRK